MDLAEIGFISSRATRTRTALDTTSRRKSHDLNLSVAAGGVVPENAQRIWAVGDRTKCFAQQQADPCSRCEFISRYYQQLTLED